MSDRASLYDHQFLAGRTAANNALIPFGYETFDILKKEDGCPVWPPGIVGSIGHSGGNAVAAVGLESEYISIGLDVEHVDRMTSELFCQVCSDVELQSLWKAQKQDHLKLCTLIFSAKEAYFKAKFPIDKAYLGFRDLRVKIYSGTFDVYDLNARNWVSGRYIEEKGVVVSGLIIS